MKKITSRILTKIPASYAKNGLFLIILLFIYGILGSHFIMKLGLLDSVYYTIITLSTVGYGDYIPITPLQKIFSITLALSGIGTLAYVLNVILTNFQNRMSRYSKGVRKMRKIEKMDSYYILCGCGMRGISLVSGTA